VAVRAREHRLGEAVRQLGEREDVELHLSRDALPRHVDEEGVHGAACVVDEHVDVFPGAFGRVPQFLGRAGLREIEHDDVDRDAVFVCELLRERVEVLLASRRDDQVRAARGERPRERRAEPARRAGDEGRAPFQIEVRHAATLADQR